MSALSIFLRGAGAMAIQAAAQRILGAVTSIVLARGLGSAGFGAFSAVINTASAAYSFVRLGIDAAIHVYAARADRDSSGNKATAELLGAGIVALSTIGLFAALLLTIASNWVAVTIFAQPALGDALKLAGVLTALQCLSQFSYAVLAGLQRFVAYARLMILNGVLTLVLCAAGTWLNKTEGALWGYGIAQFVLTVSLAVASRRAMREQGIGLALTGFGRAAKTLMRLGLPFYASGIVAVPVSYYLQGLLSRSTGVDALGVLRIIATLAALISFVPVSVSAATTSTFAQLRIAERAASTKLFDYAFLHLKVVLYFTTIVAVLVAGAFPLLVLLLFGSTYAAAIEPGVLALFSAAIATSVASAGSLFFALERSSMLLWQSMFQSAAFAALGATLIPTYGVLGFVGAELAGNIVALLFTLLTAVRLSERNWSDIRVLETLAICALGSLAALVATKVISGLLPMLVALLLIIICLAFGAMRFGLSEWERSTVLRVVSGLRRRT